MTRERIFSGLLKPLSISLIAIISLLGTGCSAHSDQKEKKEETAIVAETPKQKIRRELRERFGTREHPKYLVRIDAEKTPLRTYASHRIPLLTLKRKTLSAALVEHDLKDPLLKQYESEVESLERFFASNKAPKTNDSPIPGFLFTDTLMPSPEEAIYQFHLGRLETLLEVIREHEQRDRTWNIFDIYDRSDRGAETQRKKEQERIDEQLKKKGITLEEQALADSAAHLRHMMGGLALPHDHKREVTDIDPKKNAMGHYRFLDKTATTGRGSYITMWTTSLHEDAHAFGLHDEEAWLNETSGRQVDIVEEAVPLCIELGAPYYHEDPDIRAALIRETTQYVWSGVRQYFDGSTAHHHEAAAIADAALSFFGDPRKAINHLLRTDYAGINPGIWKIIEKNRAGFDDLKTMETIVRHRQERVNRMASRVNILYNRYHPVGKIEAEALSLTLQW